MYDTKVFLNEKKKRPLVLLSIRVSSETFSVEKELGNTQLL